MSLLTSGLLDGSVSSSKQLGGNHASVQPSPNAPQKKLVTDHFICLVSRAGIMKSNASRIGGRRREWLEWLGHGMGVGAGDRVIRVTHWFG